MTLKAKYILFITLIHLAALVMSFLIFDEQKQWFILSEAVLLISLYFSIRLYRDLVQPLGLLSQGMDALQDQDFNVKFQPTGQYETDKLIRVYNQMIDRLREERTAQVQQHFFLDKLISTSPVGIIILDFDGNVSSVNPRAEQFLEMPEKAIKGQPLRSLPTELAAPLEALPSDSSQTIQINGFQTFKCHKAHFIDRGFAHYFITLEELTAEKLRIEKQAYGKVIRMMAHEVNNSVGPINSILDSILIYEKHLPESERTLYHEVVTTARDRNQRLNSFMRNFADVIRLPDPQPTIQEVQPLLKQVVTLMKYQTGERQIEWQEIYPEQPIRVAMQKDQIEQVLINVIKNAIEAIETTGRIIIELDYSGIRIRDNGAGLPPEFNQELFAPFYSTKADGQGVGLTLTREILINHDFSFSLRTDAQGLTVFSIGFPKA
ncbi:MAG: ATP-binding protein [Saprospiraceae bacterium]|nr:HAMP domain-containing protein [Lewinella sp.]